MDSRTIVSVWNNRSESTYHFGPFDNIEMADAFIDSLDWSKWAISDATIGYLNAPQDVDTGLEISA